MRKDGRVVHSFNVEGHATPAQENAGSGGIRERRQFNSATIAGEVEVFAFQMEDAVLVEAILVRIAGVRALPQPVKLGLRRRHRERKDGLQHFALRLDGRVVVAHFDSARAGDEQSVSAANRLLRVAGPRVVTADSDLY